MARTTKQTAALDNIPAEWSFTTDCNDPIYFYGTSGPYGCFSNFKISEFQLDGKNFRSSEQAIMACKALLFDDRDVYAKITNAKVTPSQAKRLGREVKKFDEVVWHQNRDEIAVHVLYHKFRQNNKFAQTLLASGPRAIIEASENDAIWGIGYGADEAKSNRGKERWGMNILGRALMGVRTMLQEDEAIQDAEQDQSLSSRQPRDTAVNLESTTKNAAVPTKQTHCTN